VCGSQPVASTRAASVAPLSLVSIATRSACFEPDRGKPAVGGFSAVAVAELGLEHLVLGVARHHQDRMRPRGQRRLRDMAHDRLAIQFGYELGF
jgi:hypothetical protein